MSELKDGVIKVGRIIEAVVEFPNGFTRFIVEGFACEGDYTRVLNIDIHTNKLVTNTNAIVVVNGEPKNTIIIREVDLSKAQIVTVEREVL